MALIRNREAPVFRVPGLTVTGLASPRRGAAETCAWRIALEPGAPGVPHLVTREQTFVVLAGSAIATVGADQVRLEPGDALIVPPHTRFALANPSSEIFEAVVALPVGGQAITDGTPFTPPWAE